MLRVLKVCRYRNSGKLIALGSDTGRVIPLNGDLSFSDKEPHGVRRDTELDVTPLRIEVEIRAEGGKNTYRIVRRWDESRLPPKSTDPSAPLEHRIDVSPSHDFSESEKRYVGHSTGHPIGHTLIIGAFFLLVMAGVWGWWPPLVAFAIGTIIVYRTKTPGDPSKIQEVKEAKERIRQEAERNLQQALSDVRVWAELDGIAFERAVGRIYRDRGFEVTFTPRTNDQGVDLILKRSGRTSIVQCKAYASNVGVSAVRELVGVRASRPDAEDAILVALFDFSSAAKRFAAKHNVTLYSVARDYLRSDYRPAK